MIINHEDFAGTKKTGKVTEGMYIDRWLKENLDGIPHFLKKSWDVVGIVSGHGKVRIGKTEDKKTIVKIVKNGKIIDSKQLGKYKNGEIINTLSWDFKNAKMVPSRSEVIIEKEEKKLYKVKLENGKEIICTLEHKLFVKRNGKIIESKLKHLKVGDELVCMKNFSI